EASARHSKPPPPSLQKKPNFVITGANEGAPVPALISEVPAPRRATGRVTFSERACARIVQVSSETPATAATSSTLPIFLLNIETSPQSPTVRRSCTAPRRDGYSKPPLPGQAELMQAVEERDAVRGWVRRRREMEVPDVQRDA